MNAVSETGTKAEGLGPKMRSVRSAQSFGLRELARKAGVSAAMLSSIETGKTNPSVATLRRIASALDVPVATFFATPPPAVEAAKGNGWRPVSRRAGIVVKAEERKHLLLPRSGLRYELLSPDLRGAIEFIWTELEPGHPETELMSHDGQEVLLVLEGELDVWIEHRRHSLRAGDTITFDSGVPHRVMNPTSTLSVHVAAITPPSF
jgi:transcriptional regulator with XRE-family HTH domain